MEMGAAPISDQTPAAAATSRRKSLASFSMPSPSWKRTKPFKVIAAPTSLPAAATTSATGGLPSITKSCDRSAFSLRYLAIELGSATGREDGCEYVCIQGAPVTLPININEKRQ